MSEITRWTLEGDNASMVRHPHGDYVETVDHATRVNSLEQQIDEAKEQQKKWADSHADVMKTAMNLSEQLAEARGLLYSWRAAMTSPRPSDVEDIITNILKDTNAAILTAEGRVK